VDKALRHIAAFARGFIDEFLYGRKLALIASREIYPVEINHII